MTTRPLLFAIAASAALLAACGSSDSGSSGSTAAPATQAPATTAAAATTTAPTTTEAPTTTAASSSAPTSSAASGTAAVSVVNSPLGDILVDAKGFTLYAFTNDSSGESTCTGGCASAWPALTVPDANVPSGLDTNVFSVAEGANETYQLKAGQWPLYTFSGDTAPGDTNGQGTGGVWFVVAPDGTLIKT